MQRLKNQHAIIPQSNDAVKSFHDLVARNAVHEMNKTTNACILFFILFFIVPFPALAQKGYWQQRVNYIINVKLDDSSKSLEGNIRLNYINQSPDTLQFIWFHLWPNAYKNDRTAFSEQLLTNGQTDFYFSDAKDRGYINKLNFRVNGSSVQTQDHPKFIDAVKLLLPEPLLP